LEKYIAPLADPEYLTKYNVQIRLDSVAYYSNIWWESGMAGIGIMSPSVNATLINNPIRTGLANIYNLDDLGVLSSLYQFGWPGFLFVVSMSASYVVKSLRSKDVVGGATGVLIGMGACVALGLMASPIPVNFFTASWTSMWAGPLIYLTATLRTKRAALPELEAEVPSYREHLGRAHG